MKSKIISSVRQNGSGHEHKKKFMGSKKIVLFILGICKNTTLPGAIWYIMDT